jgi:hypothetical protein
LTIAIAEVTAIANSRVLLCIRVSSQWLNKTKARNRLPRGVQRETHIQASGPKGGPLYRGDHRAEIRHIAARHPVARQLTAFIALHRTASITPAL